MYTAVLSAAFGFSNIRSCVSVRAMRVAFEVATARSEDWIATTPLMLYELCTIGGAEKHTIIIVIGSDILMLVGGIVSAMIVPKGKASRDSHSRFKVLFLADTQGDLEESPCVRSFAGDAEVCLVWHIHLLLHPNGCGAGGRCFLRHRVGASARCAAALQAAVLATWHKTENHLRVFCPPYVASESSIQRLLPFVATKARLTVISWTGYPIVVLLGALNTTQTVRT